MNFQSKFFFLNTSNSLRDMASFQDRVVVGMNQVLSNKVVIRLNKKYAHI